MDGSVSTSLTERTRSQISRAFVNRAANEANAKSELFEQLLNLKFTVQPPPEKQSTPSDSTVTKSSTADGDKKDAAKTDEEKDDKTPVAVAPLTQSVPLIQEKPVELKADQPAVETKTVDESQKSTDLSQTKVNEQVTASTANPAVSDPASAKPDSQPVIADTLITDAKADTTPSVTEANVLASNTLPHNPIEDGSNKKVTPTQTKLDNAGTDQPQQLTEPKEKASANESTVTNAQQQIASEPKAAIAPRSEDQGDRRSDRREKWYEHKNEASSSIQSELTDEPKAPISTPDNQDQTRSPSNDGSSQPLMVTEPIAVTPTADPTITAPVGLPATLSIVSQTSTPSTPTPTTTSTVSHESSAAVTHTPSRTVGNQTAKPNSKEQVAEPGLSQQERVRVIQRIARSFNRISSDGGTINLRLHPENLGSVSVQVRLEGRSLSARLSTETTAARDAIMQDLPALRQRLADQGFDVTKFQVDVAGNGADASFAQSNGQSQSGQSENRSSGAQTDYRRVAAMRESRAAISRQLSPVNNLNWQANTGIDLQA